MTNPRYSSPAVTKLRGHESRPAQAEVERRPRQARVTRSILTLLGFLVLAPIVFFVPPHIPWAVLAVSAGLYFAYREWVGEYVIHSLSGVCPRCGAKLSVEPGSKVKMPMQIDCFECHHKPVLQLESVAASSDS